MESMSGADQMIDPNLEPQTRNRCNTWPLRPINDPPSIHDSVSSPLPSEQGVIKEEEADDFNQTDLLDDELQHNLSGGQDHLNISNQLGINNSSELGSQGDLNAKKQSARKNAWGNLSYADLITKAIQSSPEKRLTLSQIYDWMVQNVGYFRDKGDSNSSAGWKNSIRHNLSLHNRFMRIQNEGAGKSSWWVINPDAKPGKAPRRPRGGSMDSKSMSMKATRDRAMKKVRELRNKGITNKDGNGPVSPANEFTLSPGDGGYRDRASSFASNHDPDLLDTKLSPWGSDNRLDFDYQMDTGKLPDDLNLMSLKFPDLGQTGSLLNELEDINEPYNEPGSSNMAPHNAFASQPYTTYLQATETPNNFNTHPPPPYPSLVEQQQNQQQYNKQTISNPNTPLYKDPMITSYNNTSKGNNNTLNQQGPQVPQYGYSNGILTTQSGPSIPQQHQRLGPAQMTQVQQPRIIPNSIREALDSSTPMTRPNQISQSLKESAPILTSQLLDYRPPPPTQSGVYNQNQSQVMNQMSRQQQQQQQQQMSFSQYASQQDQAYVYSSGNGFIPNPNAPMSYYPDDLDLDSMPELLSCDVDEIIQQEMKMDGGQLDLTGFEAYPIQQQQQQASANQPGIGLS